MSQSKTVGRGRDCYRKWYETRHKWHSKRGVGKWCLLLQYVLMSPIRKNVLTPLLLTAPLLFLWFGSKIYSFPHFLSPVPLFTFSLKLASQKLLYLRSVVTFKLPDPVVTCWSSYPWTTGSTSHHCSFPPRTSFLTPLSWCFSHLIGYSLTVSFVAPHLSLIP